MGQRYLHGRAWLKSYRASSFVIFGVAMWTPVHHAIVRDAALRETLHTRGFSVIGTIGEDRLTDLRALYEHLHRFSKPGDGGMFHTIFSQDFGYRKAVFEGLNGILAETFEHHFVDFKVVLNSFIVKIPGTSGCFPVHQDTSVVDEFSHSALSLWIPLQRTDMENGTLCVIPGSHALYHPYRSNSLPPPFLDYEAVVRRYLHPVELESGDILAFDNRLLHFSHTNSADRPRAVAVIGLLPKAAGIETCTLSEQGTIAVYAQSEDFFLTNNTFYNGEAQNGLPGTLIREVDANQGPRSVYDFLSWAARNGVERTDIEAITNGGGWVKAIPEPD